MPARRKKDGSAPAVPPLRLLLRIDELEARLARVEARLRALGDTGGGKKKPLRPRSPGPLCPGCSLEIPRGRRRENCVWCGFRFDALQRLVRSAR